MLSNCFLTHIFLSDSLSTIPLFRFLLRVLMQMPADGGNMLGLVVAMFVQTSLPISPHVLLAMPPYGPAQPVACQRSRPAVTKQCAGLFLPNRLR